MMGKCELVCANCYVIRTRGAMWSSQVVDATLSK